MWERRTARMAPADLVAYADERSPAAFVEANRANVYMYGDRARCLTVAPPPQPATPLEALMVAAPGDEPLESTVEQALRLEPVRDAIEALPAEQRFIVEAVFWRGLSVRAIGRELGLSRMAVHRRKKSALQTLAVQLRDTLPV